MLRPRSRSDRKQLISTIELLCPGPAGFCQNKLLQVGERTTSVEIGCIWCPRARVCVCVCEVVYEFALFRESLIHRFRMGKRKPGKGGYVL